MLLVRVLRHASSPRLPCRNNGTHRLNERATDLPHWPRPGVDREPFCERYSDGLVCSRAWDPECVWKVLGILNVLIPEVPNLDSDNDGLSDTSEGRYEYNEGTGPTDSDGDLIPDYLDTRSCDTRAAKTRCRTGCTVSWIQRRAIAGGYSASRCATENEDVLFIDDSLDADGDADGDGIRNGDEGAGDADGDGSPNSLDLDAVSRPSHARSPYLLILLDPELTGRCLVVVGRTTTGLPTRMRAMLTPTSVVQMASLITWR